MRHVLIGELDVTLGIVARQAMADYGTERAGDPFHACFRLKLELDRTVAGHNQRPRCFVARTGCGNLGRKAGEGKPDGAAVMGTLHEALSCGIGIALSKSRAGKSQQGKKNESQSCGKNMRRTRRGFHRWNASYMDSVEGF